MSKDNKHQDIFVVDYSEKAFAVFGDTKPHAEELGRMFGKFGLYKLEGKPTPGWIFSKRRLQCVEQYIKDGTLPADAKPPKSSPTRTKPVEYVEHVDLRTEKKVAELHTKVDKMMVMLSKVLDTLGYEEDNVEVEETEEEVPEHKRLLKKK